MILAPISLIFFASPNGILAYQAPIDGTRLFSSRFSTSLRTISCSGESTSSKWAKSIPSTSLPAAWEPSFSIYWYTFHASPFHRAHLVDHPGGTDVLTEAAGMDASEDFDNAGHSEDAFEIMKDGCVGKIQGFEKKSPNLSHMHQQMK